MIIITKGRFKYGTRVHHISNCTADRATFHVMHVRYACSGFWQLGRIPMSQQLGYFASLKEDIVSRRGERDAKRFLHKSLFLSVLGSNDYLNNYLLPGSTARRVYNPQAYQDLVLSTYVQQLQVIALSFAVHITKFDVTLPSLFLYITPAAGRTDGKGR